MRAVRSVRALKLLNAAADEDRSVIFAKIAVIHSVLIIGRKQILGGFRILTGCHLEN